MKSLNKINLDECRHAGLAPETVETARTKVQSAINYAAKHGIHIFMGSTCTIRAPREGMELPLILAHLDNSSNCDGGCGAVCPDSEGLERGE